MRSIVIPVYCNQATIPRLVEELGEFQKRLNRQLEVVFVIDGSPDRSASLLRELLPHSPFKSVLIEHSRNFGAFDAIRTGLQAAEGEHISVMAADLQEPLELIEDFFTSLDTGEADIVFGVRVARHDPKISKFAANTFWYMYRKIIQPSMPPGGVDVFACTNTVRDVLVSLQEAHSSLIGQLMWTGFRRDFVPYTRRTRAVGKSAWTFRKKLSYMWDSIFAFTDLPVRALAVIGTFGMSVSVVFAIAVFYSWAVGHVKVSGYTPIILMLAFSTSLILFALSIVGSYVWRTFENSKSRPLSIIRTRQFFSSIERIDPDAGPH